MMTFPTTFQHFILRARPFEGYEAVLDYLEILSWSRQDRTVSAIMICAIEHDLAKRWDAQQRNCESMWLAGIARTSELPAC